MARAQQENTVAAWWANLEPQWQRAYRVGFFRFADEREPTAEELLDLVETPALRLVGPKGPYSNLDFELTNLTGVTGLQNVSVLVISYHAIQDLNPLAAHSSLTRLFLNNNEITDLGPISDLERLVSLHLQNNNILSLEPLRRLRLLEEVYCHDNALNDLNGIDEGHSDQLSSFYCLPNSGLSNKQILKFERMAFVRALSV